MAEVGLSARTRMTGALLERWRAQCGLTGSTIHPFDLRALGGAGAVGVYLCFVPLS